VNTTYSAGLSFHFVIIAGTTSCLLLLVCGGGGGGGGGLKQREGNESMTSL